MRRIRLEAEGFAVRSITLCDGCYEAVVAVDASRWLVALSFDPGTLARVGCEHLSIHS